MKVRNGFVSNSSSSSYILALSKDHACGKCDCILSDLMDVVTRTFGRLQENDTYYPLSSNKEYTVENIINAIDELEKDVGFMHKEFIILEEIVKNKDATILFDRWRDIASHNKSIRHSRQMKEFSDSAEEVVTNHASYLLHDLKNRQNKIIKLNGIKKKIESLPDDCAIYSFTIDIADESRQFVEDLITKGLVEVIEKITT